MIEFVKLVSELLLESVNQRPNVTFVGKFFVRSLHCLDFPVLFISFSISFPFPFAEGKHLLI